MESQSSIEVLYVASSVITVKQFKNKDVSHAMKKRCAHFLTRITKDLALFSRQGLSLRLRPTCSLAQAKEWLWA